MKKMTYREALGQAEDVARAYSISINMSKSERRFWKSVSDTLESMLEDIELEPQLSKLGASGDLEVSNGEGR